MSIKLNKSGFLVSFISTCVWNAIKKEGKNNSCGGEGCLAVVA